MGFTPYCFSVPAIGWAEDQGSRAEMEDSFVVVDCFGGDPSGAFFAVYDGHGGRQTVEFLSRHLHDNIRRELPLLAQKRQRRQSVPHARNEGESSMRGSPEREDEKAQAASCEIRGLRSDSVSENRSKQCTIGELGHNAGHRLDTSGTGKTSSEQHEGSESDRNCADHIKEDNQRSDEDQGSLSPTNAEIQQMETGNPHVKATQSQNCPDHRQLTHGQRIFKIENFDPYLRKSCSTEITEAEKNEAIKRARLDEEDAAAVLKRTFIMTDEILTKQVAFSGATACVCLLQKVGEIALLHCAHLGDARAVLGNLEGGWRRLTSSSDHKATDENEIRAVEERGGYVLNERVCGTLAVTRAFGDAEFKRPMCLTPYGIVSNEPDVSTIVLNKDTQFVILACDGLWDVMKDQDAVCFVREAAAVFREVYPHMSVGEASECLARALVEEALSRLTRDNITVIVVLLDPLGFAYPNPNVLSPRP